MSAVHEAAALALRLPKNAAELRDFLNLNFDSLRYGKEDGEPDENDRYSLTAHDLLSVFSDFTHRVIEAAPEGECADLLRTDQWAPVFHDMRTAYAKTDSFRDEEEEHMALEYYREGWEDAAHIALSRAKATGTP